MWNWMRALYLLALSRLCAAGLWLLRQLARLAGRRSAGTSTDLTVVGPKANYHYGSDAHAVIGALAGCSVAGTPVDWDAMACNYTASDGSIESVPLD